PPPASAAPPSGSDPHFKVFCDRAVQCTDTDKQTIVGFLEEAYTEYKAANLPEPYLVDFMGASTTPYRVFVVPTTTDPCDSSAQAVTLWETQTIEFCVAPGSGLPASDELRLIARHELFHAVQFAYSTIRGDEATNTSSHFSDWILEGTAEAAAGSTTVMAR